VRKAFFWTHLIVGSTAAFIVLVMSVTGVLLMYERQMLEWADGHIRSTEAGSRLGPEALIKAIEGQSGAAPDTITLRSAATAPVDATLKGKLTYVDAYSGRILAPPSQGIRNFFRVVTDAHRRLAFEGDKRQLGRSLTGAANLAFLGLALSGIYLWLPRKWTKNNVRAVLWFRRHESGKARDFNWHNVIGIWSAVPLIAVILGAAVISYPWATNLVYKIAGSPVPGPEPRLPSAKSDSTGLDAAYQQAQARVPGWQTITWRRSGGDRISLTIAESHRGRVDLKSTLLVDRATGAVIEHEQYDNLSRGRQWRLWLRFIHTGEALGVVGQTVAGIVSAGAAVLVWTGIALTLRRFRSWRSRRRAKPESGAGSSPETRPSILVNARQA
jgi:uncharacterized iron-regulated membrane protein